MKMSPADITPTQDQKTTASPGREPSSSGVKSGISASFSIGACRAGCTDDGPVGGGKATGLTGLRGGAYRVP
jgi:hypothetical protein